MLFIEPQCFLDVVADSKTSRDRGRDHDHGRDRGQNVRARCHGREHFRRGQPLSHCAIANRGLLIWQFEPTNRELRHFSRMPYVPERLFDPLASLRVETRGRDRRK